VIRNRKIPPLDDSNLPLLVDEKTAAQLLGVSRSFLRKGRTEGQHHGRTQAPPFVPVGGRRLYRVADLKAWVEALEGRYVI
jgi:hypothetical protein